jgi:subtilisin family serine protease
VSLVSLSTPPLDRSTGLGVSIAVIDSGVHAEHPHIGAVAGGIAFTTDGDVGTGTVDRLGHGTAVTAAIQEKAPDAEIHVVKVFDDVLATSVAALVKAIDWASEREIRLVNLSLGTPNEFRAEQLGPAVERAVARGTLVVSAMAHEGTAWLPGSIPGALGVLLDPECPRDSVRVRSPEAGPAVLAASGYPRPIPGVPVERNLSGISFAVANATGVIARALQDGPSDANAAGAVNYLSRITESA